jgi:hypothetical protein
MATKMTKGTTRGNAAVSGTNQYLKKGGKVKTKKYESGGTTPSDSTTIKRMATIGMVPDPSKQGLYKKDPNKVKTAVKKIGGKVMSKKAYGGMKTGGTKKGR